MKTPVVNGRPYYRSTGTRSTSLVRVLQKYPETRALASSNTIYYFHSTHVGFLMIYSLGRAA